MSGSAESPTFQTLFSQESLEHLLRGFHPLTSQFLVEMIITGAINTIPEMYIREHTNLLKRSRKQALLRPKPEQRWQHEVEILFRFFFGHQNKSEIAEIIGITHQSVSVRLNTILDLVWQQATADIQQRYSRELLAVTANWGEVNRLDIIDQLQFGQLDPEQMDDKTKQRARRKIGADNADLIPHTRKRTDEAVANDLLEQRLRTPADVATVGELLAQVNDISTYRRLLSGNLPVITTLKKSLDGILHIAAPERVVAATALSNSGVPVGEVKKAVPSDSEEITPTYYFIATQHLNLAQKVFLTHPELEKYRHSKILHLTGPAPAKMPSIWDLSHKDYRSVSGVAKGSNIKLGTTKRRQLILERIFRTNNCPVPIFLYANTYYVHSDDAEKLVLFIKKRFLEFRRRRLERLKK